MVRVRQDGKQRQLSSELAGSHAVKFQTNERFCLKQKLEGA